MESGVLSIKRFINYHCSKQLSTLILVPSFSKVNEGTNALIKFELGTGKDVEEKLTYMQSRWAELLAAIQKHRY